MFETTNTSTGAQNASDSTAQAQNTATGTNTQAETKTDSTGNSGGQNGNGEKQGDSTKIEELIQKAVDRATNKLGNENKDLRKQLDDLKKEKMSDDELKQFEMKQKEKEIAEREQALKERENRLYAIKAIKEAGLDDGSDTSLAIVDFVMAENEDGIKERVKAFDALVKKIVQGQVDKTFKAAGRTPGKGTGNNGDVETKENSIAVNIGKKTAEANKTAQNTLKFYTGGNK